MNEKSLTWERLETLRLKKLGLKPHNNSTYTVLRSRDGQIERNYEAGDAMKQSASALTLRDSSGRSISNSLAPFFTEGKPTCGYFFSRDTDNKKKNFGIPPSDLVKWRNFPATTRGKVGAQ